MSDFETPFLPDEHPQDEPTGDDSDGIFRPRENGDPAHRVGDPLSWAEAAAAIVQTPPPAFSPDTHVPPHERPVDVAAAIAKAASITNSPLPADRTVPGPRLGPRPLVNAPLRNFDGKILVEQYTAAVALIERLKAENASDKSPSRRAMTINSAVRVAMTVLLDHADELHGRNEEELLLTFRAAIRQTITNSRGNA